MKEVGLEPGWKRQGVMDGKSGELTEWEDVVGAWTGRTETEGLEWGWRRELGSWFQIQGEAYRQERSVIRRQDDVAGQARVIRDNERVPRGRTGMIWCRYGGWAVVRTLWVSERSLYSVRSVAVSQCRERKIWVMLQDLGALTVPHAREFLISWRRVIWDLGRL